MSRTQINTIRFLDYLDDTRQDRYTNESESETKNVVPTYAEYAEERRVLYGR